MNPASQHQNVFISFVENTKKKSDLEKSQPMPKKTPDKIPDKFSCDKCRFSSRDRTQFHKHALQHVEMTFSCSYCNHVSYTKGESQRHLVKHTGAFPFKCQFCPYGAVRNDYIVKHTQRVHKVFEKKAPFKLPKKRFNLQPRPILSLPPSKTCMYRSSLNAGPEIQPTGIISKAAVSNSTTGKQCHTNGLSKVQVELLSPLNEPIQHNEPLTIAYPPEMTIPPGCFVELVEVKTVNGTKELELKVVSQHASETDLPVKDLAIETGRTSAQSSHAVKPTFRCSVIPQENKVNHPDPSALKQSTEKRDLSSLKTVLNVPCDQFPGLRKQQKETTVIVKEDPDEDEREIVGKIRQDESTGMSKQIRQITRSSGKYTGHFKANSLPCHAGSVDHAMPQSAVRFPEPSKTYNLNKIPNPIVPKEEICDIPIPPTRNSLPPAGNNSPFKGQGYLMGSKPFVKSIPEKRIEASQETKTTSELPVISSVFSIRQGPGIPGCIRWEQTSNGNQVKKPDACSLPLADPPERTSQNGDISAVSVLGNAKDTLSGRPELTIVDNHEHLKRETSCTHATMQEKETNTEVLKSDLSCSGIATPKPVMSGQTSVSKSNEISPAEIDTKNPPNSLTPTSQKRQKILEESLPVFIPQGAVLKISDSNKPSLTLKISTHGSDIGGSWMPRPVLFSGLNEENISDADCSYQNKVPKLSLKRRKSGVENKGLADDWEQQDLLTNRDPGGNCWTLSKHKKRKKHKKASKVKLLSQTTKKNRIDMHRLWLVPHKEDQLVKCPGPNQPVVVLNHPKPQALRVRANVQSRNRDAMSQCSRRERSARWRTRISKQSPSEPEQMRHTLKMKLKKVHQNKYQVVGFVYRDFPTKTLKG